MIDRFNQICEFRQANPGTRGNGLSVQDPSLIPLIEDLTSLRFSLEQRFQNYRGFEFKFEQSKGQTYFPSILHLAILPPKQTVSKGIYVVICFDKLGRGALAGCAESKTNPMGLNTIIRKIPRQDLNIDVDGLRPTTKYNNTFENPKEFYFNDLSENDLINHLQDSLDLCLYHLSLIDESPININTRVNAKYAHENSDFNIDDIEDGREKVARHITLRRGQKKFRDALIKAYNGTCAVTGSKTLSVLEAAHIVPYKGNDTNVVQNGILLRSDIHTLFDLGLLTIIPNKFEIKLHQDISESEYSKYNKLTLPSNRLDYPNEAALLWHNENEFKK
jgi:hypothetical protein